MHSVKVIDKGYDDVILVFSTIKTQKGKFKFFKQFIDFKANIIFISDYHNNFGSSKL